MKEWTNSTAYNAVTWIAVIIMIGLTLTLVSITVKQMSKPLAEVQRDNTGGHPLKAHVPEPGAPHLVR
jgi:hypothetical protein